MLTYTKRVLLNENAAGNRLWFCEGHCLSTDTKPTSDIANGSCLIEMDTATVYFYDEAGSQWLAFEEASGGSDSDDTEPAEEET